MTLTPIILAELQRGGPPMWVSGRTYPAGFVARSPTTWQHYVRVRSGAGGTDPAGDSANWMPWSKGIDDALASISAAVSVVRDTVNVSANNIYGQVIECQAAVRSVGTKVDSLGRMWTAAAVIEQGGLVMSPLDREVYRRTAASGASATDPADDIANYVAASYVRSTALPPGYTVSMPYPDQVVGITRTAQTNIPQGTRTQVLNATGRGQLLHIGNFRGANQGETAGVRLEIFVDGRKLLEWEEVMGGPHYACHLGNAVRSGDYLIAMPSTPVAFRRSVAVWITPTYKPWVGNTEYVGFSLRVEA